MCQNWIAWSVTYWQWYQRHRLFHVFYVLRRHCIFYGFQGLARCSGSCDCKHACLFRFPWAAFGKSCVIRHKSFVRIDLHILLIIYYNGLVNRLRKWVQVPLPSRFRSLVFWVFLHPWRQQQWVLCFDLIVSLMPNLFVIEYTAYPVTTTIKHQLTLINVVRRYVIYVISLHK